MKLSYRPEIDGLRALAVIPVILFHAGFELFSGGFVGVDVFFVISGYLITSILIEDIENKRFSIAHFYERRARRILPALFVVMFTCIPFAWMWMMPDQLRDFAQSLIAVSFFASNILFWRESDYFAAAAEEKPLLHTWSLAVEEQYYLLFPIFLILAWRFGKNRVFWLIVVMAGISLLLSEWGWRKQPTANFYLAPTRAWELFAGSIAAFIVQKKGIQKNNFIALIGLLAILFSIFVYDKNTPFPSLYAAVPVIGTVLLILYADKKTYAAKLLSNKTFVGIGLISYSAYLWHQPLFAFARIELIEPPSNILMGFLVLATFLLAYGSWKYIEKPFRQRGCISGKFTVIFVLSFLIFFCYQSFNITLKTDEKNFEKTIKIQENIYGSKRVKHTKMVYSASEELKTTNFSKCLLHISENINLEEKNVDCKFSKVILLFGDSHARDVYQSLGNSRNQLNSGLLVLSAHKGGCRLQDETKYRCINHYRKLKKFIKSSPIKPDILVYIQAARNLVISDLEVNEQQSLSLINLLSSFSIDDNSVVWIGPRASIGHNRKEVAQMCINSTKSGNNKKEFKEKLRKSINAGILADEEFKKIAKHDTKIKYLSQINILEQNDYNFNFITDCNDLYWSDQDHLSKFGEKYFSNKFVNVFNSL